jgi:trehalose/maltose transport system substrate-binding protein
MITGVAACAIALSSLSGCAQGAKKVKQTEQAPVSTKFTYPVPPVPHPTRKYAGQSITCSGDMVAVGGDFDLAMAKQFEKETGVRVKVVPVSNSVTETYANYQRILQAKSPDLDVLYIDIIWPGALSDHLVDLKAAMGKDIDAFLGENVANNTVDGKLAAVPLYLGLGLLYYRTDLLKKYGYEGPPRTWEELEAMSLKVVAGELPKNPRMVGYVWQGATYEGLTCNALEWQAAHGGGNFIDPVTGKPNVKSPEALASYKRAASWIGKITPVGVTSYQEEDARNVFQSGNALFMRNWVYAYPAGNAEGSPIKGKFAATALPRAAGAKRSGATLGGWQLGVSKYSEHKDAAAEFVKYMTSSEAQAWRAKERLFLPTMPALYERADVLKAQPFLKVIPEALRNAVARPSRPTRDLYNEASAIYFQGVAEILQGGDAEFAAGRMHRDLEELLKPEESR